MICPHCRNHVDDWGSDPTARDPDGDLVWTPFWRYAATLLLLFVFLVGAFSLHARF